ncbi:MAG: acetyl/propionyl/methylcrotonyl-CoA carboxylase subunit alpha [Candidatus Heimdallarchaeota archaeon]
MFDRILIANRGEIAARIIASAQEMGISTVAIYSDVDVDSVHVHAADFAYPLGDPTPRESYLNMEKIIGIALESDSQAIHPGYGFLSENAEFAQKVQAAGLIWIGPSPDAIDAVGDKIQAKNTMQKAGIPIIPGYHDGQKGRKFLLKKAEEIGFPLLIKATAGGGGRGMRIVNSAKEFGSAYDSARREAQAAFGNGGVFLEKYLERVRHIEFQILGDHFGNIIHLNERECSIQRRHQKIIEETPSPALDESLRIKMGEAAINAARAVNYTNAGSVEFILDEENNFYFLEINARLQVEHAITEATTGIDLVKWQIRIANGQQLELAQKDVSGRGHSMEFRIYAERPESQFMPSAGKIHQVQVPVGVNIRNDLGIPISGGEVSTFYDPMIAKLIVHAETRDESIQKMKWALRNYTAQGIPTNIPFLKEVLENQDFLAGNTRTDFVYAHFQTWQGRQVTQTTPLEVILAAALFEVMESFMGTGTELNTANLINGDDPHSPWQRLGTWGRESLEVLTDKLSGTLGKGKSAFKKILPRRGGNLKSSFMRNTNENSPWRSYKRNK